MWQGRLWNVELLSMPITGRQIVPYDHHEDEHEDDAPQTPAPAESWPMSTTHQLMVNAPHSAQKWFKCSLTVLCFYFFFQ
ncbi:hypothetical protein ACLKA7_012820 [Drosophila subpalustris]